MFALVDCNNFYASCERLFQPALKGRPVVILSNNDGCVIARSDEAKAIGIEMGTPAYMMDGVFTQYRVAVFSSNYTLYGDLSDRVMKTLASFVPRIELYSIDEAFLDLGDMGPANFLNLGFQVKTTIQQHIGIPVSVGIAPTKTLAKMANRYAKKKSKEIGVFYAGNQQLINEMLQFTDVGDIWGIGRQHAALLTKNGFRNALDVTTISPDWMRSNLSVTGLRLWNELRGVPSIDNEFETPVKKNICTSRSFGKLSGDKSVLAEAASNYAAICALKLRNQKSCARAINIMVNTNQHKTGQAQYSRSVTLEFETPTNLTGEIIHYALKGLDIIYKPGYLFKKVAIMVQELVPESEAQSSLFDSMDRKKGNRVLKAMDAINKTMGKDTLRMATQQFERRYRLKAEHLSRHYTTRFDDILKVNI